MAFSILFTVLVPVFMIHYSIMVGVPLEFIPLVFTALWFWVCSCHVSQYCCATLYKRYLSSSLASVFSYKIISFLYAPLLNRNYHASCKFIGAHLYWPLRCWFSKIKCLLVLALNLPRMNLYGAIIRFWGWLNTSYFLELPLVHRYLTKHDCF
jgi:hypothetical protein